MTTRKDVERIMNEGCERPIGMDSSIVEVLPLSADAKKMFADALQAIDTLREFAEHHKSAYGRVYLDKRDESVALRGIVRKRDKALSATDAMKKEQPK
jgi:hypothetical protein